MYKMSISTVTLLLLTLYYGVIVNAIPDPIICEDSLDGTSPPFDNRDVPCLLGCGVPVAVATGSLLPGSVNETDIPYCQLNCVHDDATPAQSAAAAGCRTSCEVMNQGTPENIGWCMYWCVDGYSDLVETTACVPSLTYGGEVTTTDGSWTVTYRPFTNPPAWQSWYQTQTVLPRSTTVQGGAVTSPTSTSTSTPTVTSWLSSSIPTTIVPTGAGSSQSEETLTSSLISTGVGNGTGVIQVEPVLDTTAAMSPSVTGAGSRPAWGVLLLVVNIVGVLVLTA